MKPAAPKVGDGRPLTSSSHVPLILLLAFGVIWTLLAIKPWYRQDWLLENVIVLVTVPFLALTYPRAALSRASYVMIFAFLVLHEVGAHYTYSEVPYDAWWQELTGVSLNASLGWERNHYDRLVHLLFGLLIAYPVREMLVRSAKIQGVWSYVFPLLFMVTASTTYEMIEWGAAEVFGGELGMAYLGTQGDIWDAHKDTAAASVGAMASMLALAMMHLARREH